MSSGEGPPVAGQVGSLAATGARAWKTAVGSLAVLGYAAIILLMELLFAYLFGGMLGAIAAPVVMPFVLLVMGSISMVFGASMWITNRRALLPRFRRLGIGAVLAGLVAVAPFPWLREIGRDLANRNLCGYGLAHRHYFIPTDNAGNYPPDIHTALGRYPDMQHQVFCPSEPPASLPDAFIYIPNQTKHDDPRNVLLYEKPGRHPGGGHVVFLGPGYEWIEPYSRVLELVELTKRRLAKRAAQSAPASRAISQPVGEMRWLVTEAGEVADVAIVPQPGTKAYPAAPVRLAAQDAAGRPRIAGREAG